MGRSFRAGSGAYRTVSDDASDPYGSSLNVGELDATVSQVAFHGAESRVPDPRRDDTVEKPVVTSPSSVRAFRAKQIASRPLNDEDGLISQPLAPFAFGVGMGGAPTGAPSVRITDPDAHDGYDPVWGTNSDHMGVGPLMPGNFGSFAPRPNDSQAHEVHRNTDKSDPRHDVNYQMTLPQYEKAEYAVSSTPASAQATLQGLQPGVWERPESQFLNGRPARRPSSWLFTRAFDQWASQRFSGQRVRPTSPPDVSGSQIDQRTGPHASMPIRNTSDAPETNDAYPGAFFGPSGMQPVAPSRNSWRLQPTPWDTQLTVGS